MSFLNTYKPFILEHLNTLLPETAASLAFKNRWSEDAFKRLASFSQNGKMFRGSLFLFSCKMFGQEITKELLDVAVSLEVLQSSILIHDDVMDNDRMRRNEETIFVQYENELKKNNVDNAEETGKNLAICVGDIGFFLVNEIIAKTTLPDEVKVKLIYLISREFIQVGIAQMSDCVNTVGISESKEEIFSLYIHKTARYTFSLPFLMAAIISHHSQELIDQLSTLGEHIGLIFQIQDELLGLFGDEKTVGKSIGSDIRENRKTLYKAYLYQDATEEEMQKLNSLFGSKSITEKDVEFIKTTVKEKGIYKIITDLIESYTKESIAEVESLKLDSEYKEELKQFILMMSSRSS